MISKQVRFAAVPIIFSSDNGINFIINVPSKNDNISKCLKKRNKTKRNEKISER